MINILEGWKKSLYIHIDIYSWSKFCDGSKENISFNTLFQNKRKGW